MHLLSSQKTSFSLAICGKCLKYSVAFPVAFFEQLASHVSADIPQLKLPGMKFFLIHTGMVVHLLQN